MKRLIEYPRFEINTAAWTNYFYDNEGPIIVRLWIGNDIPSDDSSINEWISAEVRECLYGRSLVTPT